MAFYDSVYHSDRSLLCHKQLKETDPSLILFQIRACKISQQVKIKKPDFEAIRLFSINRSGSYE